MFDFFKSVNEINANDVREQVKLGNTEDFNLIDVRENNEYADGHLPGAVLIPIGELKERARELDPNKPTVAY